MLAADTEVAATALEPHPRQIRILGYRYYGYYANRSRRARRLADPLDCSHCGAPMRNIALIGDTGVIKRIPYHLSVWDPQPEVVSSAGPVRPGPKAKPFPAPGTR